MYTQLDDYIIYYEDLRVRHEILEAILHKFSLALAEEWFAKKKAEEAREKAKRPEVVRLKEEALRRAIRAALKMIDMSGATRRALKKIEQCFEGNLLKVFKELSSPLIKQALRDVVAQWEEKGLGKRTPKYFSRFESWSDEKAEEIAVRALKCLIAE